MHERTPYFLRSARKLFLRARFAAAVLALWTAIPLTPAETTNLVRLFIGTYTGPKSDGIYTCTMDAASGALGKHGLAAKTKNPSFLTLHPNGRFLYAISEVSESAGRKGGGVLAYAVDAAMGRLTPLNEQSSGGDGPCHVVVDATGSCVLVANYGGGSVSAFPVGGDGRLSPASSFIQHAGSSVNRQRQSAPHAHQVITDPANRFAFVSDLGTDQVMIYRLDATQGALQPNNPPAAMLPPGSGPRHLAFHPNHRFAYAINELTSTVTVFQYDPASGALAGMQTLSTLPSGFTNDSWTAEIAVHPSGRFVYGSNRGHDSIAVFAVNQETGRLTLVEHEPSGGKTPRFFGLDPSGKFLLAANQNSDSIVVFRVDERTGQLTPTGHRADVGAPVCVAFVPSK